MESRLEKLERYTSREVERRGPRRYNAFAYLFKPFARFLHAYLFKGGFRDGHPGLIWAMLDAQYKLATIARQDALARQPLRSTCGQTARFITFRHPDQIHTHHSLLLLPPATHL